MLSWTGSTCSELTGEGHLHQDGFTVKQIVQTYCPEQVSHPRWVSSTCQGGLEHYCCQPTGRVIPFAQAVSVQGGRNATIGAYQQQLLRSPR